MCNRKKSMESYQYIFVRLFISRTIIVTRNNLINIARALLMREIFTKISFPYHALPSARTLRWRDNGSD